MVELAKNCKKLDVRYFLMDSYEKKKKDKKLIN